jgi:hypothetical protein
MGAVEGVRISLARKLSIGFESLGLHQSRGLAQPGRAPALGAGCRMFESCIPDH